MNILVLDIEGTIVDDWFNFNVLQENVDAIKAYISKRNFENSYFFTYAFWNRDEVKGSNKLRRLADIIGIDSLANYENVFTKTDVLHFDTLKVPKYSIEIELMFNERYPTKQYALIQMVRGMQHLNLMNGIRQHLDISFIDDTNEEVTVEYHCDDFKVKFETLESIRR